MSPRCFAALFAVQLVAACAPGPPTTGRPIAGPGYGTAAIYRLDFQGIGLGMRRDEVCRSLVANGYRNEAGGDCGPFAPLEEGDGYPAESYEGWAPQGCPPDRCRPDSPSARVQYISLDYRRGTKGDFVVAMIVRTSEPDRRASLAEITIRDWGQPSYYHVHGYSQLIYGYSAKQADSGNRERFDGCRYIPECEIERGTDCGAVLNDFATANASVTINDGSRLIEIEDPRPSVGELRAAGRLRGRRYDGPGYLCSPAPIH